MSVEGTKYRYVCNKCDQCNYPRITVDSHVSQSKFTNADRIRAMSDEEIANFLCNVGDCDRRCPQRMVIVSFLILLAEVHGLSG